jgi:hypothetical protein
MQKFNSGSSGIYVVSIRPPQTRMQEFLRVQRQIEAREARTQMNALMLYPEKRLGLEIRRRGANSGGEKIAETALGMIARDMNWLFGISNSNAYAVQVASNYIQFLLDAAIYKSEDGIARLPRHFFANLKKLGLNGSKYPSVWSVDGMLLISNREKSEGVFAWMDKANYFAKGIADTPRLVQNSFVQAALSTIANRARLEREQGGEYTMTLDHLTLGMCGVIYNKRLISNRQYLEVVNLLGK